MVQFDLRKLFRIPNPEQRIAGLNLRPDLARAALKMVRDERSDQEIVHLETHLTGAESVIIVVEGSVHRQLGFLALTTERVLFRMHHAKPAHAETLWLQDISAVKDRAKGMNGRVSIHTAGAILEVDKIPRHPGCGVRQGPARAARRTGQSSRA